MGVKRADTILEQVGSIDELCSMSRGAFLSLDQVGPATANLVGIWDKDGNPVDDIPENPCPNCSQEYDRRRYTTAEVKNSAKVCAVTSYRDNSTTLYVHKN
jgi:hypothetical protein